MSLEAEVALGGTRCMASLLGVCSFPLEVRHRLAVCKQLLPLPAPRRRDIDHLATWSVLNVEQEVSESVLFDRSRERRMQC